MKLLELKMRNLGRGSSEIEILTEPLTNFVLHEKDNGFQILDGDKIRVQGDYPVGPLRNPLSKAIGAQEIVIVLQGEEVRIKRPDNGFKRTRRKIFADLRDQRWVIIPTGSGFRLITNGETVGEKHRGNRWFINSEKSIDSLLMVALKSLEIQKLTDDPLTAGFRHFVLENL